MNLKELVYLLLLEALLLDQCIYLTNPSIGLHPRDNEKLISVMKQLRDIEILWLLLNMIRGIISSADRIIDMGPFAGTQGGEIIAEDPERYY